MAFSGDLQLWFTTGGQFSVGTPGQWDETIFSPSFIKTGSTYYIYYQGYSPANNCQIGFASAPVGAVGTLPNQVTWTKCH